MKTLSIVIPCYNEAKNIPILLGRLSKLIKRDDIEIIIVDNGSSDDTENILNKIIHNYKFCRVLRLPKNKGYGNGIKQGLLLCNSEYIGWTHADLQTEPSDIVKGLKIIEDSNNNTYVKGLRKARPLFDRFFTISMSLFETLFLNTLLWDINAQPNIFPIELFKDYKNPPNDFSFDLYYLYIAKKNNYKIKRFDVEFNKRKYGISSWNTSFKNKLKFILRTLQFSFKLKKKLKLK